MKTNRSSRLSKLFRVCTNCLALVGAFTICSMMISWNTSGKFLDRKSFSLDVNVSKETAQAYINAYKVRYFQNDGAMPKGFFISRSAVNYILDDQAHNGIYIYPALNSKNEVCTILEGGSSRSFTYKIMEGIQGRVMMSESTCPTDCGSLLK